MTSSLIGNTNQVHFASVLAMDNAEMVAMFEALVASGLNVQGKMVEISEEIFSWNFQLPVEGLIDINEVPKDLIFDARTEFSFTGEQLTTSCKKRELKEYRLLSDIVAKSITVKAGSFDAVTHERFLMMTAIFGGKSRVKPTPGKRAVSKKRPDVAVDEQVVKKKRTLKGKAAPSKAKLKLVSVALDAEPIQTIDPTSADDVDIIIEQEYVTPEADQLVDSANDTDEESVAAKATGTDTVMGAEAIVVTEELSLAKDVATMTESEDTGSVSKALELNVSTTSDEESIMKFAPSIEIPGVHEGDWYKASLPQISTPDKGKAPLVKDTIKGHPAREMFSLICAVIDFLVQLREKVIADVVTFFHSSNLSKLGDLELVKGIIAKEKQLLAWADTDSLETAVRRREFTIAKYREMLLRKFMESIANTSCQAPKSAGGNHWSVIFRPISHHSSVLFRYDNSVDHHSDDIVGPFRHNTSVCPGHNVALNENYNNISSQLGELVAYINRVMTKRGKRVATADLNRLLMIRIDPVGVLRVEEVVLVKVAEEMIEGVLNEKGIR
ncbi:hypothetical protein F511_38316 [Dorcoceras hygrometricum]|uniref:Uncharacterized protein n=1 Tax=Dorcoceras hygrometricum TaxID=472368 RepID=A0A2Z7CI95_9LAMI|nr:hypothetical protein F511_38316 [Dorcoceras hygrometricum]